MEIASICRICLQNKQLISIFQDENENLAEIIYECTFFKIQKLDGRWLNGGQICIDCKRAALTAFKFKKQCEKSYRHLEKILNINPSSKCFQRNVETQTEYEPLQPCEFCDEKFVNNLKIHQDEAHIGCAIECRICDKAFKRISNLRSHLAVAHPETGFKSENQCSICMRQFLRSDHLRRHLQHVHKTELKNPKEIIQEDEIILNIENVNSKAETEINLNDPTENEHEEELLLYINQFDNCSEEDEDNEPLSILQQTQQSTCEITEFLLDCEKEQTLSECHSTDITILENEINIDETVEQNEETENPRNRKTLTTKKQMSCEECGKIFQNKSHLKRHQATRHKEKTHICHICQKKFKTSIYLQRHISNHSKKRYICKECPQNFQTKEELHAHFKAEGHDKPLLCPECGLRCRTSNILTVHLRRHKGEKPFKCKFCSKGFPRSDDLKLHEKYHTGEKSHFCGTCGKGFQRKYNLTIHLRVHTGEKPYKCQHCPQAFAQSNDLKAHVRRHTGERFRCKICDAAFLQFYQVRQHKLTEHGIKDNPPIQRVAKFTSIEAQREQIQQNLKKDLMVSTDANRTETED